MKSILRCFEMASGPKVNFDKSSIIGINVEDIFLEDASLFLNCKCGVVPFKYLGIPISANLRCVSTWQSVFNSVKKRLSSWKGKHLSLGGHITFINSVLSSLPKFFLSFFKAPKKVLSILVSLRRIFLSAGVRRRGKFLG